MLYRPHRIRTHKHNHIRRNKRHINEYTQSSTNTPETQIDEEESLLSMLDGMTESYMSEVQSGLQADVLGLTTDKKHVKNYTINDFDAEVPKESVPVKQVNPFHSEEVSSYVFWDTETSGLSTKKDTIIEFAAKELDPNRFSTISSYHTLVHTDFLSSNSVEVTNVRVKDLEYAPKEEDVVDGIYGLMNNKIWVGHNIKKFDKPMLEAMFARCGKNPPKPVYMIDTLEVAREFLSSDTTSRSLDGLSSYFGIDSVKHRAMDDVDNTIEVFKYLCMHYSARHMHQEKTLSPQSYNTKGKSKASEDFYDALEVPVKQVQPKEIKPNNPMHHQKNIPPATTVRDISPESLREILMDAIINKTSLNVMYNGRVRAVTPLQMDNKNIVQCNFGGSPTVYRLAVSKISLME